MAHLDPPADERAICPSLASAGRPGQPPNANAAVGQVRRQTPNGWADPQEDRAYLSDQPECPAPMHPPGVLAHGPPNRQTPRTNTKQNARTFRCGRPVGTGPGFHRNKAIPVIVQANLNETRVPAEVRRRRPNPRMPKPAIISAQVAGSGTAAATLMLLVLSAL